MWRVLVLTFVIFVIVSVVAFGYVKYLPKNADCEEAYKQLYEELVKLYKQAFSDKAASPDFLRRFKDILDMYEPNRVKFNHCLSAVLSKIPLLKAEANTEFHYLGKIRAAKNAIDGDMGTHWAGDDSTWPMILTVYFDKNHEITKMVIYQDGSQITSGKVEYYDGSDWITLITTFPIKKKIEFSFEPVKTDRIRLVVYDVVYPPSWYNKSPTINEIEVYGY